MKGSNNEFRMNFLRRQAKEVRRYKVVMKILAACLASVTSLVAVVYVSAALYRDSGSFTISLNKAEMTKYGLSLSEKRDMSYKTSHLDAAIVTEMTNIDGNTIPQNVDNYDGEHNGEDYIAYTFYLQNAGEEKISYEYALEMSGISQGLDEAIRVKLYVNGKPRIYAKAASDGSGPEPGTEAFSGTTAASGRFDDFLPGDITKYTIVVWIEGNDPDCVDWLIGGKLRLEMNMRITDDN